MDSTLKNDRQQRREARERRAELIRAAAIVRQNLGQTAQHLLLDDGQHQVVYHDCLDELRVGVGKTVETAIAAAKGGAG
ncbi:MAG: hypothetical protein ACOY3P_25570 [Planctomycetota bacterium]